VRDGVKVLFYNVTLVIIAYHFGFFEKYRKLWMQIMNSYVGL